METHELLKKAMLIYNKKRKNVNITFVEIDNDYEKINLSYMVNSRKYGIVSKDKYRVFQNTYIKELITFYLKLKYCYLCEDLMRYKLYIILKKIFNRDLSRFILEMIISNDNKYKKLIRFHTQISVNLNNEALPDNEEILRNLFKFCEFPLFISVSLY